MDQFVGTLGTVITSCFTAIVGPIIVYYLTQHRSAGAGVISTPASTQLAPAVASGPIERTKTEPLSSGKTGSHLWAIASLGFGIFSLIAWLLPICGLPISILGMTLGVAGLRTSKRVLAIVGIGLSLFGLVCGIINSALGAYQGYTGQLFR